MTRAAGPLITIEAIEVAPERLEALVHVLDDALMRTSSVDGLSARAVALLPGLKRHTCENDAGLHFGAEIADTEMVHLIEHVTVELMALSGSPRSLRAETRWDFAADGRGRFRISIAYDDDLVALGALKEAVRVVEWLIDGGRGEETPDPEAIAARFAALRTR